MKHPEISDWADYVRALAEGGERAAMQSHLDGACELCRATLIALERVVENAESTLAPPTEAVRSVKAFFALQHPQAHGSWKLVKLRTAFDSWQAPAPTASRGHSEDHRQLLFESDEYIVELSVDYSPGTVDAVLRGQILEAHGEPRSQTPVFLVGAGRILGRALSEQHGTFEMSGRLDLPCELWVFPEDENRIRLSLDPEP